MLNLLVAAALLTLPGDSVKSTGQLRGRVVDGSLDRPLPAALVRLSGVSVRRIATTGVDGSFVFPDIPAGPYALSVDRDSYQSSRLSLVVPLGREVVVDVQLTRRPSELQPVVVIVQGMKDEVGGLMSPVDTARAGGGRSMRALDLLSQSGGAMAGILGSSSAPPPPQGGGKSHTLFVWGTSDESGRVLLDGATLSAPLHLGGLMPTMDPELIDDARLRTAGASARYDGGTGYVLELSTRDPAPGSLRTWGESDLLADRAGVEVPLGGSGSVLAGARRVREGMLSRLSGAGRTYGYGDALARMSLRTSERGHVAATLFGTSESIRIPRDQGSDQAEWQNRAGSVVWQTGRPASRNAVRLTMTEAMMDLPLLSTTGGHLRADVDRAAAAVDHQWEHSRWQAGVGGEVERVHFGRAARVTSAGSPANAVNFLPAGMPGTIAVSATSGAECAIAGACASVSSSTGAIFGDFRMQLAPRLRFSTGVRLIAPFDRESASPLEVLPRVAVEALLAPHTTLRLSAGGFSQLGAVFSDAAGGTGNVPGGIPALDAAMVRNHSAHAEVALAHQWGRAAFGLSAFAHQLRNEPRNTMLRRAEGVDASWAFATEWLSASASYSLIRRTLDSALTVGSVGGTAAGFDSFARGEHLVSANVEARASRARLTLSGAYVRGLPFSSIVLDRPTTETAASAGTDSYSGGTATRSNAPPERPYVRLDATLSSIWCLGHNDGCHTSLAPYVRLINALDRRDALFYYHDGGSGRPLALAAFPAIVSVGIKWEASRAKR